MSVAERSRASRPRTGGPGGGGRPAVIQGGMGVGVSGWPLARAVARTGQLGVLSGVALDATLARRLQLGDPGGHLRRALAHFPGRAAAERIVARYFVPGGLDPAQPFRPVPRLGLRPSRDRTELSDYSAADVVRYLLDAPAAEDQRGGGPNGPPRRDLGPQRRPTPQEKAEETKQTANGGGEYT